MAFNIISLREYGAETAGGLLLYGLAFFMLILSLTIVLSGPQALPKYRIIKLRIHPIKSCHGIELDHVKLLRTGLRLDRKWMFVDAKGRFVTIRENPRMTLIRTSIVMDGQGGEEMLEVKVDGAEINLTIATFPTDEWLAKNTTKETVTIWGTKTDAHVYPSKLTAPLSEFLGQEVRLALKGSDEPRIVGGNGSPKYLGREEHMLFPDLAPLLVANSSSLDELNSRLEAKGESAIPIDRFRPNVVLEEIPGSTVERPWSEDRWKTLRFGDNNKAMVVDVTSRCARCQVPNVDEKTGHKHTKEPWTTLMSYRRVDEGIKYKPCFGMLCAPRQEGELFVGMEMTVTKTTTKHKWAKPP